MTTELGPALREISEAAATRLLAPASVVRARGDQRRRRTVLGASAAVALATAGIVLAVGSIREAPRSAPPLSPGPTQPSNSATYPFSNPLAPIKWYRIPAKGVQFDPRAIAADGTGFVVVGDSSTDGPAGPAAYWSTDGKSWKAPDPGYAPDSGNVTDVIHTNDGFLAVGVGRQGPAAWRTDDGRRWTEATVAGVTGRGDASLWGLNSTSMGYFAWGRDGGFWQLWRSSDGTAWSPISDAHSFDLTGDMSICSLQEWQSGLRVVGYGSGRRVFWQSNDGETWTRADSYPSSSGCGPYFVDHSTAKNAAGSATVYPSSGDARAYFRPTTP